ncbi:MAG: GTP-binding protein [Bacteroidales bacterium]|nr:GTP-binding protein [Bacteroidales bacterium]HOI32852.1 Rab family GTPase [Bacteroidales bacterium]
MIKKKVAMVGAFAVGKTSLVQRFVRSIFSEKYHTTIGVKIDQKELVVNNVDVTLLLWDIHGEDDFMKIKPTYLIGSSGYFLVADGTRSDTYETAIKLHEMTSSVTKNAPFILLVNKADLRDIWEITETQLETLKNQGWKIIYTSAKTGDNVEEAFVELTKKMLQNQ